MNSRTKKIIAPVVIVCLVVMYLAAWGLGLFSLSELPLIYRLCGIVVPVGLIGVSVYVLIERIREIESGEEDDLSKY